MNENNKMNAMLDKSTDEFIDFDKLEAQLEDELEDQMSDLQFLESEREQIGNPDSLGKTIKNVVWEQFLNQVAVTAGEDFIKENNGLTLDLSADAHIQTTENFKNGKIATHNTEINYQQRYNEWQDNFAKDENGNIVTHKTRSGKEEPTLIKGARKPFDESRPKGSARNHTDMDHTISAAEIIRDPEANAHLTKKEQIDFANSEKNLFEMDSSLNRSKSDKSTTDWLDTPNANGQKPKEIFDISDEDDKRMRQKDEEAREAYEQEKAEGERRSIEAGNKSRKKEAFRIGGKALRAVVMQLLAELVKEIIGKLVSWLKEKKKSLDSFIENIKIAIKSFVSKLKTHMVNAANTLVTTIATAIIGPVVEIIKKVWMILKQGWKSLKEAIAFFKNPKNQNMPISLKILEVGRIIMAGLSAIGALALGEVIENVLLPIPVLAVEIPLIGSLASIIGIFLETVVAGLIGAIVINLLDRITAKKRRELSIENQVDKGNEILKTQKELHNVAVINTEKTKKQVVETISKRHVEAGKIIKESVSEIFDESKDREKRKVDFDEIDAALDGLLD